MKKIKLLVKSVALVSVIILPIIFLDSCSFCVNASSVFCQLIGDAPLAELTGSSSAIAISSLDTLIVYHGSQCAKSTKSGNKDIIKIEGIQEFPAFVTSATVYLNGWNLEYLDPDHHVAGLGVIIKNIRLEEIPEKKVFALKWDATGILSDQNMDDSYSMCYTYTVIAWNDKTVNLNIDHDDGSCTDTDLLQANFYENNNAGFLTALSSYKSFLFNSAFINSPVAILPRGFGMGWSECGADHHLLQVAYNLDHSEKFIENEYYNKGLGKFNPSFPDKSALVDSGFVSWESHSIFKDNTGKRGYEFGEMVSGLSGSDLSIIDPPYTILPNEDNCDGGVGQISTQEIVVSNIPFQYAIPMLTGWELGYTCDDEHIKKAGVWIDSWSYTKDPVTGSGTLRYKLSADFSDKNSDNSNYSTHNVTILGIKPLLPSKIASTNTIDLIPVAPPGSDSNSFCRTDAPGNMLIVTIKNQGTMNAEASVTSVVFGRQQVNVVTPPIKAGESAELQFRIPGNCFDPDCEFTIISDSEKKIDEGINETNNNVTGICKPKIF